MKYLVVTGGTVSGLGKGTTISSIGVVLKGIGLRVTSIKIDPYLNIDAGTMSPYEHGEVFVLHDGGEVDLDLGNYERFLKIRLSRDHNITTGKLYEHVLKSERKGEYLGKTVQVVPHVTDAVQQWVQSVALKSVDDIKEPADVCLIEIGGTVGDIESAMFLEAFQQLSTKLSPNDFCLCHVTFVPVMGVVGEQKTKPSQHSVRGLRSAGLRPDFLFCRCDVPLEDITRDKIAVFCQVPKEHVISVHDVSNIYRVPLELRNQGVGELICKKLCLAPRNSPRSSMGITQWELMAERVDEVEDAGKQVTIGVVGKYTGLQDSYLSVIKALKHSCIEAGLTLDLQWIESTDLEPQMRNSHETAQKHKDAWTKVRAADGLLVPGGFGGRGIDGKCAVSKWCREAKKPYLGICLGLQTAIIDIARNVLGLEDANSEEFDKECPHKVVKFMPEIDSSLMGGNMRLGEKPTMIESKSLAAKIYGKSIVYERHRHRYEVNPAYIDELCKSEPNLRFSGVNRDKQTTEDVRMEILEIQNHPFFFGCQFHPEFLSQPLKPSPPFLAFVLASAGMLQQRLEEGGGVLKLLSEIQNMKPSSSVTHTVEYSHGFKRLLDSINDELPTPRQIKHHQLSPPGGAEALLVGTST
eukprot:GHVL01040851.1.p1 GENE.GHVL01040851.1~~GHVL01040851.1.p1  ORF type:complete len:637 (-),score=108.64 GHVL01040851.1:1336-3246(-)